jgi:hypothetical protein
MYPLQRERAATSGSTSLAQPDPIKKKPFETGPQYSAVLGKRRIQEFQCKKKEFGCYAFLINRNYIQ